jgi:hypothetical protein
MKGIQMTRIMFDVYAIKLTEENIPQIVEATLPLGWTLDHLQDNMEVNADMSLDTILYLKLYQGTTEIATFNDVPGNFPSESHRMTDTLDPKFGIFYKTEKI